MARSRASTTVPGRTADAERLWYDPQRWPAWIEGFAHVVELQGDWPERGARVEWQSVPGGRGLVQEAVVAFESRTGQTLDVEDATLTGRQQISFTPRSDEVEVTLTLEYRLKQRNLLTPVVDALFVRRAMNDALRRTLTRFANERKAQIQFG